MTTKIAVSLPDEVVATAKQAVRQGRAASVSAFVADAITDRERRESLATLVADILAQDGEPSGADYAWADRALGMT